MNSTYSIILLIAIVQLLSPTALLYGRGLPDSKNVLEYIVHTTRESIFSMGKEMAGSPELTWEAFSQPEQIAGMCELAESVIIFVCDDLGLSRSAITRFQGASILGDKAVRHASVLLTLPDGKTYLIDPTFGQFLHEHDTQPNQIGFPGVLLRKTLAGQRLAGNLVTDGYILFDDKTANLYGKVLSRDPQVADYNVRFFLDNNEGPFKLTRFILGDHVWQAPPEHFCYR